MGLDKTEFLDDKVRVHYSLKKANGTPNVSDVMEVPYDSMSRLAPEPKGHVGIAHGENWREEVDVPQCGKTLVFVFNSYQERGAGPNEEDIYGPYLKDPISS